jgi:hypothetical protein
LHVPVVLGEEEFLVREEEESDNYEVSTRGKMTSFRFRNSKHF